MKSTEITRKPIGWFQSDENARLDLGPESELRNLGKSILLHGQFAPVGALRGGRTLYGFRRIRGLELEGGTEVEVKIFNEPLSEATIKSIQIVENMHRLDMTPYEKFAAYDGLRGLNPTWTAKQLAEHLNLDAPTITKGLSPSKCIPEWREALRLGQVGLTDCYAASQASEDQQRELLAMKLAGASRDTLARAVRRTKAKPTTEIARASRIAVPLPGEAKLVISGQNLTLSEIVDKLSECLAAAKKGLRERLDAKTWERVMKDTCTSTAVSAGGQS